MMNEHSFPDPKRAVWTATGFCAVLSAVTVIAMTALYATSGGANPSVLLVFLCNLPLAFMFAAYPVKAAHERIQALEVRLRQLEAAQGRKVTQGRSGRLAPARGAG